MQAYCIISFFILLRALDQSLLILSQIIKWISHASLGTLSNIVSYSTYIFVLFQANPCQHPIVILRDVREQDMEALLRFMYNGEVHIGQEQLTDFLKTAQTLQVRGLADVPTKDHQKLLPVSTQLVTACTLLSFYLIGA